MEKIKMNEGKEKNHAKLHFHSYELVGNEKETQRTVVDENDMEMDQSVIAVETSLHACLNFYFADLSLKPKRQGKDHFKMDCEEEDELAAAMARDARISTLGTKKAKSWVSCVVVNSSITCT